MTPSTDCGATIYLTGPNTTHGSVLMWSSSDDCGTEVTTTCDGTISLGPPIVKDGKLQLLKLTVHQAAELASNLLSAACCQEPDLRARLGVIIDADRQEER